MSAGSINRGKPFEVRIHRGAHEIGGNCVELRHGQVTLILDIGKPLSATRDTMVPLPPAIGLDEALRPEVVIPIHTDAPDAYATTVGEIVQPHADGTWWTV